MPELVFPTAPTAKQPDKLRTVESGAFWPVIDLQQLREAVRIDNTVTPERLHFAAVEAAAYVNGQCAALEAQDGTLAATDSVTINGQSRAEWRYRRAVYCYTKAALLKHYADYDAAGKTADAESWLIVEVAHRLGDSGYTCSLKLEARLQEERAGEKKEDKGRNAQT